jgi:transposase
MKDTIKYVGLDVSKEKIAVAIADEGREAPRYYGMIPHTPEAVRKLVNKLGDPNTLRMCYESGPTGYPLYRQLLTLGVHCDVIAPSLIPQRAGERIKTDRRDSIRLAQLYRAGELTPIYIPTTEDEALRDLVRAREDAKEDELRAKHRLTKFLLRNNLKSPSGVTKWSKKYRDWLDTLKFESTALRRCSCRRDTSLTRIKRDRPYNRDKSCSGDWIFQAFYKREKIYGLCGINTE